MKIDSLIQVLCAAHLAHKVRSPFSQRGGVMLVAPPGALKTSLVSILDSYPDVVMASDFTTRTMVRFRDLAATGKVRTVVFTDFQKLYERRSEVSANLEGNLRALVDEGFRCAAFEDERAQGPVARCMVIAAMTQEFYRSRFEGWEQSGFARRFLWINYILKHPEKLRAAIERWEMLEWKGGLAFSVPVAEIKYTTKESEAREISKILKHQPGQEIPQILLQKIVSVLRWRSKRTHQADRVMAVVRDLAPALSMHGAELEI